jgi:hypothetical protein
VTAKVIQRVDENRNPASDGGDSERKHRPGVQQPYIAKRQSSMSDGIVTIEVSPSQALSK